MMLGGTARPHDGSASDTSPTGNVRPMALSRIGVPTKCLGRVLFVLALLASLGAVAAFSPAPARAETTIESCGVSRITQSTAVLCARVNPHGPPLSICRFEYGPTSEYDTGNEPCGTQTIEDSKTVEIHVELTKLSSDTTYYYELATRSEGAWLYGDEGSFKTLPYPPAVFTEEASSVTLGSATLNASVNPDGAEVRECVFEYGTTTAYGSVAPCTPSPASEETWVPVSASVTGLSADTTYYFRVTATNSGGIRYGEPFRLLTVSPRFGASFSFAPEDHLGEPGVATTDLSFTGGEYFGSVEPVTNLTVSFPAGTRVDQAGFPVCNPAPFEEYGRRIVCPSDSAAGPATAGHVTFHYVEEWSEAAEVHPFFGPENTLLVLIVAHPLEVEILATGSWETRPPPYGPALHLAISGRSLGVGVSPPSVTALPLSLGTSSGALASITVPTECTTGAFHWAVEATFRGSREVSSTEAGEDESRCLPLSAAKEAELARKAAEQAAKEAEASLHKQILAALEKALTPSLGLRRLHRLLKTGTLAVTFKAPTAGTLSIAWYQTQRRGRRAAKAHSLLIAYGKAVFRSGGTKTLLIRLTKPGKRLLKDVKHLKLTAKATFIPTGKSAVVVQKTLLLKL